VRTIRVSSVILAVMGLVVLTAWILSWPVEKAIYLAPVIVIGGGAAVGLLILWGKVAWQSLQESRRPKLVLALWLAGIGLIVLLSVIGIELPSEGH
jgi:hypothetical protein